MFSCVNEVLLKSCYIEGFPKDFFEAHMSSFFGMDQTLRH